MSGAYRRVCRIGTPRAIVLFFLPLVLGAACVFAVTLSSAQTNTSEAALSLGEPKISQENQTTTVELPVSTGVSYSSRMATDPERVVVDLPGVDAQKLGSRYPGSGDVVEELRIQAQPAADNRPYAVVEVVLRKPTDYRVEQGAEGLKVVLAVEGNRKADTISRIQADDEPGLSKIRIAGNGQFGEYKVRKLNKLQLAIDVQNVKSPARHAVIPTPSTAIKRLAVDGSKGAVTTILADFSSPFVKYDVERSGSSLVVNVHTSSKVVRAKSAPVSAEMDMSMSAPADIRDDSVKVITADTAKSPVNVMPPEPAVTNMAPPVTAVSPVTNLASPVPAVTNVAPPLPAVTNVVPPVTFTVAKAPAAAPPASKKPGNRGAEAPVAPLVKTFSGKPISLDLQEADIKNVLRLLADVSGANIVIEPDVAGKVTLKVNRVPWDQVLDMILAMNNLGQEQMGGVIRVARQDKLKKELGEREAELRARQQVIESAREVGDITTNYLQVNYAQAGKIASKIEKMKSAKGKITVDDRTNLILYSDYPAYIQSARELLAKLDLPTPQVLIESRIVQLNVSAIRDLGIDWSFSIDSLDKSGSHRLTSNFAINHAVAATSLLGFGFGQIVGRNLYNLDIQLSATEQAGKGKVVSAPRVLTLDNVEATIIQGQQIPYRKLNEFGVVTTEFKDATLELKVTPHITPDQKVRLEIKAKKEQANFTQQIGPDAAPAIDTRRVNTELLVADGDTIVIGGVVEETENLNESRTPGLSQVPIIGGMFKNEQYQKTKNELLIFISPRITGLSVPLRTNKEVRGPALGSALPGSM